ncbi:MAG: acyl-CoA dehydrogenase family protein, partial [Alcanivoracaceae bacterium]|nr:acyl-CoA dehydrogenase family protein [Alcanivoracaceae bacterium]
LAHGDMGQAVAILAPIGVANALTAWGSADQQARYLPAFTEDKPPKAAIAVAEPSPLFDPAKLATRASKDGDDYVLNGKKSLVPLAAEAELFLVAAQTDDGPAVFIVEGGTAGLSCGEDPTMGIRAAGCRPLLLENVRVPASNRLGDTDFDYRAFIDLGTLAWCALAIGACQGVMDYVIPYCNERKAFGEPISYRQAVAFIISDMAIEIDSMRMLTYRAACRAEQGKSFQREAYLARTLVKDKAMKIGTDGVQLLGGHGFTHEYPVERWYRDLRVLGVAFGGLHL